MKKKISYFNSISLGKRKNVWQINANMKKYNDWRFEIGIQHDVIAVHLEAVLVVDDNTLNTLGTFDKYLVNFAKTSLHL